MDNRNLYELYNKRANYRTLRENVIGSINVLSRSNINDSLNTAINTLNNNYVTNDIGYKVADLENIKRAINSDLQNLNSCLVALNNKLNSLNRDIQQAERAS